MSEDGVKVRAGVEQGDRILGLIWVSMIASVLVVAGVGFALGPKEPAPGVDAGLMSMILLGIGASMAMPAVVVRVLRDRAFDTVESAALGIARYQSLAITAIAMSEGIGLLGMVALMMGLPIFVASVLLPLSIGLVFVNKPSMRGAFESSRLRKDLA